MTMTERRPGTEAEDAATRVPDRPESRARARAQGVERAHGVTIDVRYVGHSTVRLDLSSLGGPRVLTDPFLRDRLGPLRRHGELPTPGVIGRIDLVAISHAHPDHFDRRSLTALAAIPSWSSPVASGARSDERAFA